LAKSREIWFSPLETKKAACFDNFSNTCPIPTPKLVCRKKFVPHHYWCNFNRFNTILNNEILLNLIGKMKYLTDQFQVFLFLHWQYQTAIFISALATQLASLQQTIR